MNLRREVLAYTRACEYLLSLNAKLTDDERSLLEYYVNELSREFLSDKPTVRLRYRESVVVEPDSHALFDPPYGSRQRP